MKPFHQWKELLLQEKDFRTGIIQHELKLMGSKPNVQGNQHTARFQNPVVGFQEAMTIGAEKSDPITGLGAGSQQRSRQTRPTLGKFRVRETICATNDCRFAGKLFASIAEKT